ncbi:MAG: ArnT family glycosyltransferase [Haloarculaceae archaeon]
MTSSRPLPATAAGRLRRVSVRSYSLLVDNPRTVALALAVAATLLVYTLATQVFPYHTTNHDEAVYLQQAAMLLEGQLYLRPPVEGAFRPWFFVDDPAGLYPKYAPVPAAMFAVGKLLGGARLTLAAVAGGTVWLTYAVGAEVFDRHTGALAAGLLVASPLFLIDASVFLSYVPTTLWNLAFATAYLRADRTGDRRFAAAAGLAVGIAFFARPYTAVLFATPFVAHALWTLRSLDRERLGRHALTALGGLLGVAAALGYNAAVTGSPLVFPYQAFAPADGLGFGHREILDYSREYTPALATRANALVVWNLLTEWVVAGPLGTLAAVVGASAVTRRGPTAREATLGGVFLTVVIGNVYFWGNLNILGELGDPTDGLIRFLGPYYHVDTLLPLSVFAAVGIRTAGKRLRSQTASLAPPAWAGRASVAVLLVGATIFGTTALGAAAAPIADNQETTEQLEQAYEPFEQRELSGALVFLPTPYGDWLNHPFQHLRNDPGFDGETVYALRERQFAVVDAYPDRAYYRYTYHGRWAPFAGEAVDPHLQRVRVTEGRAVRADVTATLPEYAERVSIRATGSGESGYGTVPTATGNLSLSLVVTASNVTVVGPGLTEPVTVPVDGREDVELRAFVDYGTGAGFSYRIVLPVERTTTGVRVLTPYLEACRDARLCGGEAAAIPDDSDRVSITSTVSAVESNATTGA